MKSKAIVSLLSLLMSLSTLGSLSSLHAASPKAKTFQSHLKEMEHWAGQVGIHVISLHSGKTIWEHHGNEALVPASLVKLFTSYAALKTMGPDNRFTTSVWAEDEPVDGRIQGNLWIKGEGDLLFDSDKASILACQLKEKGIRSVEGGILVDNSYFEPLSTQVCLDGDCSDAYNPVISATSLNFNSIQFQVSPGKRTGAPVLVTCSPPGDYVCLSNQGITASRKVSNSLKIQSRGATGDGRERFQVTGRLSIGDKDGENFRFNVDDPANFVARSFRAFLRLAGIDVRRPYTGSGRLPSNAKELATHESPPLGDLLYGLNRYSNNFMAETLFRSMGAKAFGNPGTMEKGLAVMQRIIHELGIPQQETFLDNGSGLSRKSRVSPRAFCRLLQEAYRDPLVGSVLLESMAVCGQEGTLRKRMCDCPFIIQGKTGTLADVVAFAGYVSLPGIATEAVAVILNDVHNIIAARKAVDCFIQDLPMLSSAS